MPLLHRIIEAETLAGYRLRIRFEDGITGVVDVSHLVGQGVFSVWADPECFARVAIDHRSGTVVWPNGADLAPDVLYDRISGESHAPSIDRG